MTLPKGWLITKLQDLGSWSAGGTPSRSRPAYYEGDIPWFKTGELVDGVLFESEEQINHDALANSSAKLLPVGTLLVAMYGATIGKTGILAVPAATNQACAAFVPSPCVPGLARFVQLFLISRRDALRAAGQGGAQPNLSQGFLRSYDIPLPPENEQRRIVAKLDSIFTATRAAKARLGRLPSLLDKLKRSVLATACRGDLTADWRTANADSVGEWKDLAVSDCLAEPMANGRSVPDGAGAPVLRLTALRAGRIDLSARKLGNWTASEAARFYVKRGDFLVARGNGSLDLVGRGGIVEDEPDGVAYPDTLIRMRMKPDLLSADYLRWVWESPAVRRQIEAAAHTTAGIHKVSQGDLGAIRIPVPSIAEQDEIVKRLNAALLSAGQLAEVSRQCAERISDLERATLTKAFRGELVEQDPADEPARDLLERLRAMSVETRAPAKRRSAHG